MTMQEYRSLPATERSAIFKEAAKQGYTLVSDFLAEADEGLIGQILLEDVHAKEA